MADIFNEVDEEIRRERARQMWEQYGGYIVALALIIVAAVGGWRGYQWWEAKRAAENGASFEQAATLATQDKNAEAQAAFAKISADGTSGYRMLARLREAALTARSDVAAGVREYDSLANDNGAPAMLRDLARLRAAMLLVDTSPFEEVRSRIEPIAQASNPFRHSAREVMALAAWKSGDVAATRRWADTIIADAQTPPGTRARIDMLLALAGESAKG